MGKIIVSENVSLDGVVQGPTREEGFAFSGWFDRLEDGDREAWAKAEFAEALGTEALLLGRRTYEWFVAVGWPARSGAWADRLRSLPKYVVSSTRTDLEWDNATVLKDDVVNEIAELRKTVNGDIVVYGSGRLVHTLIEHDLVDEFRLMVCPFVLGDGARLFGGIGEQLAVRLAGTRAVGAGLVCLTYRTVRDA